MKHTILSLLLLFSFTFCILPVYAEDATDTVTIGAVTYQFFPDHAEVTNCDKSVTSLTIPETAEGLPVTRLADYALSSCTDLSRLELPDTLSSLGEYALYGCTSLTDVRLPEQLTTINARAFENCTSLRELTLPEQVTTIGEMAFSRCRMLERMDIPKHVMFIGDMAFYDTDSLTEIVVSEQNPAYTSRNGVLFSRDMTWLLCFPAGKTDTQYVLPYSVRTIHASAFRGCRNLQCLVIPEHVRTIGNGAFAGCTALERVVLSSGLTSIPYMGFYGCSALRTVHIPDSVTEVDYMAFYHCTSLHTVTLPSALTEVGGYAFSGCTSLRNVYFNGAEIKWNLLEIAAGNTMLTEADQTFGAAPWEYTLGDVNFDGTADATDAAEILMAAAEFGVTGVQRLCMEQQLAADVNGDGEPDATDAAIVLMYAAACGTGYQGTMETYVKENV